MRTLNRVTGFIGAIALVAIAATAVTLTTRSIHAGGGDDEAPITGAALDRASAAALAHTGGGRVTGTEIADEESLYEVEVTLDDGTEVDVQLDANFAVVSSEAESGDEGDDANDD